MSSIKSKGLTIIIACSFLVFLSMGVRQSFGIFLKDITTTLNTGREGVSLALAMQNLLFGFPIMALVADRLGFRLVVLIGAVCYSAGMLLLPIMQNSIGLYFGLALLVGWGLSSTSNTIALGAVAKVVPDNRRGMAFGVVMAMASLGTFLIVLGASWLQNFSGSWQSSFNVLGVLVFLAFIVIAIGLPGRKDAEENLRTAEEPYLETLKRAGKNRNYLYVLVGFFVCGFHVAFISAHFPSYLTDSGLSSELAATALSLIGLLNIAGSFLSGVLADRYRKKFLLTIIYTGRAILITGLLLLPLTPFTAIAFACIMGFLWLATVAPTSGLVAHFFGVRYLATLYGFVFFSHQVGAFIGVWLGGRIFDQTGSYTPVWIIAIILSIGSALLHLPVNESIVKKPSLATT